MRAKILTHHSRIKWNCISIVTKRKNDAFKI